MAQRGVAGVEQTPEGPLQTAVPGAGPPQSDSRSGWPPVPPHPAWRARGRRGRPPCATPARQRGHVVPPPEAAASWPLRPPTPPAHPPPRPPARPPARPPVRPLARAAGRCRHAPGHGGRATAARADRRDAVVGDGGGGGGARRGERRRRRRWRHAAGCADARAVPVAAPAPPPPPTPPPASLPLPPLTRRPPPLRPLYSLAAPYE